MAAYSILDREYIWDAVPVTSTKRGFAIPSPAVLRTLNTGSPDAGDKEWDGRSAPFTWNKTKGITYLAKMQYKPLGKAGFTKTILSVVEVSPSDWNQAHLEWKRFLSTEAENISTSYRMVLRNIGIVARRSATPATPVPNGPIQTPVPTQVAAAVTQVLSASNVTWDPNDSDIAHDLFEVPDDNPNFIEDPETFEILDIAMRIAIETGIPQQVLIYGDTSTGKTEHPLVWAARRDILHCRIDCGAFGEIYDVTGPIKAIEKNGSSITEWVRGKTIRAMADPRPAVIQMDEVNRISDVKAMNVLFPFFDNARKSYFDDAQAWMKLNGVKLIVCTMNGDTRGDDIGEYVGTQPLDQAFVSRFPIRRQLRYPDAKKLATILEARNQGVLPSETIQTVAEIANELVALNKFVPNLRELFSALDFLKNGKDLFHALKWTVGGIYKDDGTAASDYTSFKSILVGKGINTDE